MTNENNTAQAANDNPLSDEYVNAIIQRHGYDSPECVIARLHQWIGLHGGENGVTLLMYEAHKALSKLRAPVADERGDTALPPLPRSVTRHRDLGDLWDATAMHQYAVRYADLCRPWVAMQARAALESTPDTAKETADKILRERMAPVSVALGLDVMFASAGNGAIQITTFDAGTLAYSIGSDGTARLMVSFNCQDAPETLTVDQVKIIPQVAAETQPAPRPAGAPVAGEAVALELRGVPETIKEGDGFWRSCTGCHELNEGRDTGPYSAVLRCHLGQGCSECGGIGAIWDSTDYQAMADDMARDMGKSVSAAPQANEAVRPDADAVDLARAGMELHSSGMPEHTVCAELVRLAGALKQPHADKAAPLCSCPSGDGSLRHPCPAHPQTNKGRA
ncbi:hypothetical protein [Achromobacter ruhlandii]|uniref:hypothetical protein n=1 Tax=Achromobacter ruhlandii TaxID=72557 RepID=UPI0007BF7446|nr:hypothetical protein [Achromobacter ruhlandii]